MSIESLNMSERTTDCLKNNKILTVEALRSLTRDELYSLRNLGVLSRREILMKLKELG